ncbi:MAG: toprim domain-containing protein [Gaiellaceae bacterium]
MQEQLSVTDFYTDFVLPALSERLDQAFPEFGWRRDARGWIATNEEHTHSRLGVRAERVVAHGPAPRGFLVHGGVPTLWTAYVSGGPVPRGEEFVRVVKDLAARAGVDSGPIERSVPRDRRADLLHDFFELCKAEFLTGAGAEARSYLGRRDFSNDAIEGLGLGVVPAASRTREELRDGGYSEAEIAAAGIVADSRWPGRLCGGWRTEHGRIGTLWARTLESETAAETRYLYLRGASRTNLPPYGLAEVLVGPRDVRRELALVEGFIDFHQLRARGFENVAALGGTSTNPRTFERLSELGVEVVTLCFDRDGPGRLAAARGVEQAARARRSPSILVLDPERLAPAKDPDALVRARGIEDFRSRLQERECGIAWRAYEVLGGISSEADASNRRSALSTAGAWLGTLPPRLALEQEDAVQAVARRCGYSPEAVERAFRARFWNDKSRSIERHEQPERVDAGRSLT